MVNAIVKSPYLKQAGHFEEANKWVFYDVVGLFTVYYSIQVGESNFEILTNQFYFEK